MADRRRLLQASLLAAAVATLQPALVLGGGGGDRERGGAPKVDTEDSVLTPTEAANFATKEARLADIKAALSSARRGGWSGGIAPQIAEDPWDPPASAAVDARARQQAKWFWCGPAAAQVVINWSRGYFFNNLNGENAATNWRKQSTLASWMGTNDQTGTWGGNLAAALNRNDAVLKPVSTWVYSYRDAGTLADFHTKVVTDVWAYQMPLVAGVAPHLPRTASWLPSWPRETNAHHYIVISAYEGLHPDDGFVDYLDSARNYNGDTGKFQVLAETMWQVIEANQGKVIW
jgi:hypothetical protein